MPAVIVPSNPKGLPLATTGCPTFTLEEVASVRGRSVRAGTSTSTTARSVETSLPTTFAVAVVPSWKRTVIVAAPETTWAFVTMWPLVSVTKPEAVASLERSRPQGSDSTVERVSSTTPAASFT